MQFPSDMDPSHKTTEVIISKAKVDKGIYNTVKWMNSLAGIETRYCCEGGEGGAPYVCFLSDNIEAVQFVLERVRPYIDIDNIRISFTLGYGMRFSIRFKSYKALKAFEKVIKDVRY